MGKNIAVVFGGRSNESEVSIVTGTMACNILLSGGDAVIPLYLDGDNVMYTGENLTRISAFRDGEYKRAFRAAVTDGGIFVLNRRGKIKKFVKIDVALNCCHGGYGEGGAVSGLFALCNIPFASARTAESAVFLDKYLTKLMLRSLGVKTVKYEYLKSRDECERAEKLQYPIIVKPAKLGSSIGVECAENREELEAALDAAFEYDDGVICEKYIENRREINCAAYFSEGKVVVSECEEALTDGDVLTFDDKYSGGRKSVMPAEISVKISDKIKRITSNVYGRLNMRGIVRFDYLLDGDEVYLSEINTVPGSLSYYLLSGGFKDFYSVLKAVAAQAERDFASEKKTRVIKTSVLKNIGDDNFKFNK